MTHGNIQNVSDRDKGPAGFLGSDSQHIIRLTCPETVVEPLVLRDKAFFGSVDNLIVDKMDSIFLQRHMCYLPIL